MHRYRSPVLPVAAGTTRNWPTGFSGRAAPDLIDWAIAAGCFAAFTVPVLLSGGSVHPPGTEAAFGAMAAAPLIVRRKWPVPMVFGRQLR